MSNVRKPSPTNRRQFIAWLTLELRKQGVDLPGETNYKILREAVESHWLSRAPQ